MTKLKVLKNFGFRGAPVVHGDLIEWDQALDGDTLDAFASAGLCEIVETALAPDNAAKEVRVAAAEPVSATPVSSR